MSKMALAAVSMIMFPIPKVVIASTTFPTTLPADTASICLNEFAIGLLGNLSDASLTMQSKNYLFLSIQALALSEKDYIKPA